MHKNNTSAALIACATSHYSFDELVATLPRKVNPICTWDVLLLYRQSGQICLTNHNVSIAVSVKGISSFQTRKYFVLVQSMIASQSCKNSTISCPLATLN